MNQENKVCPDCGERCDGYCQECPDCGCPWDTCECEEDEEE